MNPIPEVGHNQKNERVGIHCPVYVNVFDARAILGGITRFVIPEGVTPRRKNLYEDDD
jgi:hypothetical protein